MIHDDRRVPDGTPERPHVERPLETDRFAPALRQALMARNSGQVFRVVSSEGTGSMTSWVFDGVQAMEGVRLTHFLADVHARRASRRVLAGLVAHYLDEAERRLREEHDDVMRHWDPKLARFKRKRQIVLSDQAASDLLDD